MNRIDSIVGQINLIADDPKDLCAKTGHGEHNPQSQQTYQRLEGLGAPKPEIKMVRYYCEKQDIQHILEPQVSYDCEKAHACSSKMVPDTLTSLFMRMP